MANWSMMKRSILIGSVSGPNFSNGPLMNSFYETLNKRKLFSADKYPSTFPRKMEAIVYIFISCTEAIGVQQKLSKTTENRVVFN